MTTEMRWLLASLLISLLGSCNEEPVGAAGGGGSGSGSGSGSVAAKPTAAGGGFSADLAKEFASATGDGSAQGSGNAATAGSGDMAAQAGNGDAQAGSGDMAAQAGSGDAQAGSGDAQAGSGDAAQKPAGGEPVAQAGSGDAKPTAGPERSTPATPVIQASGTTPKKVTVPAELAAIKFGMLPNWERDVRDAGTLSLAVKFPGRDESAVFVFRYGYEDASAPADRDAYRKWLGDKGRLTVRQDRQAGAAWFLEGNDGRGNPAFRVVVNWGGKRLICYGSLYRDAASSRLGDLRDQTIIQAKQICETISL
jgi:hypothetical protein